MRDLLALPISSLILAACAWAQPQGHSFEMRASNGLPGDEFGKAVALDGSSILVGTWQSDTHGTSSGTAYIFDAQTGEQLAQLAPSNPAAFDAFGAAVDIQGDRLVVGSPLSLYGSADVFVRSGDAWVQEARFAAFDGAPFDNFGYSVAIDGDTAAIGSFRDDDNGNSSGSVYVYRRTASSWTLEAKLISSDGQEQDWFGTSLALVGNTLLIGAPSVDTSVANRSGAVYVFVRSGTLWTEASKLVPAAASPLDYIGYSVDLAGSLAVLGAPTTDFAGADSGASYVFARTSSGWVEQARLLPSDGAGEDMFGLSVATDGARVLIGANGHNAQGNNSGATYEFVNTGTQWVESRKLLAGDGVAGDNFGVSVAIHGDAAVIGASWTDDQGAQSGSAYAFDLSTPGSAFCFGAGLGTTCPCAAGGAHDSGCANASNAGGARLSAAGQASMALDDFRLHVSGLPSAAPALVLQGSRQVAGGLGLPAGNGLLCTTGQVMRSQVQASPSGTLTFEHVHGAPFGQVSYGHGARANYQVMYRDVSNPCSAQQINFSNGWTVNWTL